MCQGRLILITGGAASGKSAYAEETAIKLHAAAAAGAERKPVLWYAAAMHNDGSDPETVRRIKKHREQRAGKGFTTVERERDIAGLGRLAQPGDTVLLEDLPNLLANEMFPAEAGGTFGTPPSFETDASLYAFTEKKIVEPLIRLAEAGVDIVAVGNRLSEDLPLSADKYTEQYVTALEYIQCALGKRADEVTEVVCGIPVSLRTEMEAL